MDRCNNWPPLDMLSQGCGELDDVVQGGDGCGSGCEGELSPLRMDVNPELDLMDCWMSENAGMGSSLLTYYIPDGMAQNIVDPVLASAMERAAALYQETVDLPNYKGPFKLYGSVSMPEKDAEGHQEGGLALDFRVTVKIPRKVIEAAGLGPPKHQDIFLLWDIPFFRKWSQPQHEDVPNSGFYFEVLKSDIRGFPFSGAEFTYFELTAKRDTRYNPERRLFGDVPGEDYL